MRSFGPRWWKVAGAGVAVLASLANAGLRPNFVVILADDMGFSDLGCYGGEIETPRLDALAARGVRFSRHYNTARCCPTRASILTGLYPHRAGVGHMMRDDGLPGYRGRLNEEAVTVAEALAAAGYVTAMSGKWHLGQAHGVTPWTRGFQRSLNAAAGGFYFPDSPRAQLFLNGDAIAPDDPRLPRSWYATDLWTDVAIRFVEEAVQQRRPFFLYLAYNAPHFPLQAPSNAIARFRGRYLEGWDALRERRLARQRELGLWATPPALSPRPSSVRPWAELEPAERDRFDHLMATYAACVHLMDAAIGRLVDRLAQLGVLDNTALFFLSDNGGNAESGPNGRSEGDPTTARSNWFCGESWALLQNTPFRRYKHYVHEGGIATPLIVHWPAGIREPGRWVRAPSHVVDIPVTVLDLAGVSWPREHAGRPTPTVDGVSLRPFLEDPAVTPPPRRLFWEHEGHAGVLDGALKLVRLGRAGAWELYDTVADPTETLNLASERPNEVRRLSAIWEDWARRSHALPAPAEKEARRPAARPRAKRAGGDRP